MGAGDRETALRFGISIVPATETLDRIRELVQTADEAGLGLIGIQDHPYQRRFLDTGSADTGRAARRQRADRRGSRAGGP